MTAQFVTTTRYEVERIEDVHVARTACGSWRLAERADKRGKHSIVVRISVMRCRRLRGHTGLHCVIGDNMKHWGSNYTQWACWAPEPLAEVVYTAPWLSLTDDPICAPATRAEPAGDH